MRILVLFVPRSGSKLLVSNIHRYLEARFGEVLSDARRPLIGADELLNVNNRSHRGRVMRVEGNTLILGERVPDWQTAWDPHAEFRSRAILMTSSLPIVAKYKPVQFSVDEEVERVAFLRKRFDATYLLRRNDLEEHRRSWCIAEMLNCWHPDERQRHLIEEVINNPLRIPPEITAKFDAKIKRFNAVVAKADLEGVPWLEFDKLIALRSAKEFCDYLSLPYVPFDFEPDFVEYGERKQRMIQDVV